jgi:hypothetical protein
MSDERPDGILGSLPQTRPHRRSAKRPAAPAVQSAEANPPPTPKPQAQPARKPQTKPRARATPEPTPPSASNEGVLGTAVQAAAELAEIGLSASARALRGVLSRLPRP